MLKRFDHKNLILFILALAQFMVVLDVSIVNVALPSIFNDLHFHSDSSLQWVVTAYSLAFGGFLLLGGRAADLYGRKRVFVSGVLGFAVASLLGGFAQNSSWIETTRAIQGLAAAFMSPAAMSIVLVTFRAGRERNRALSIWGAIAAGGAAAGVLLGGIITQYLSWRWNFFINVFVGSFVIVMSLRYIKESKADLDHSDLDLRGAALVTSGLMLMVYAFTKAPTYGWTNDKTIILLLISLLLLVGFIINEFRTEHPLVPMSIFRLRNLGPANATQLPITAGLYAMFFFVTLYVQTILNYSPVKAGLGFLPITFIIGFTAILMSRVISKIGYKLPIMVGPIFMAAGLLLLEHISISGTYLANVFPGLAVMGFGMGMSFVSITIAATNAVPAKESGLASGLLNTSGQIGGSLGLAILSGVSAARISSYLTHHVASPLNLASAQIQGYQAAFMVGVGFTVIAFLVATIFIKHKWSDKVEVKTPPVA